MLLMLHLNSYLLLQIVDAIISHGCFLRECSIQRSIVGLRARLETGVDLAVRILSLFFYIIPQSWVSRRARARAPFGEN